MFNLDWLKESPPTTSETQSSRFCRMNPEQRVASSTELKRHSKPLQSRTTAYCTKALQGNSSSIVTEKRSKITKVSKTNKRTPSKPLQAQPPKMKNSKSLDSGKIRNTGVHSEQVGKHREPCEEVYSSLGQKVCKHKLCIYIYIYVCSLKHRVACVCTLST